MWGKSVHLTRLGGFDIRVDASWLVIAALLVWSLSTGYFPTLLPGAGTTVVVLASVVAALGLFTSLVLHELAHSIVARRHGLEIRAITLFLFGGVAELDHEPTDPETELRVALVGPLASLGLAALFWSATAATGVLGLGLPGVAVLRYLMIVNLVLAVFNLIPALPLDGGRVYRALLWRASGDLASATRRAAALSAILAWAMIGFGVIAMFQAGPAAGLWPILIGGFLLMIGRATWQRVEMQQLSRGRIVADLMSRSPVTVDPGQSLAKVVDQAFLANGISFSPVIEGGELLGFVDLAMIRRIDREHWATTRVEDVLERPSEAYIVSPDCPVPELMDRMARTGQTKLLVVKRGRLAGVVTLRDLVAFLDISRQIIR